MNISVHVHVTHSEYSCMMWLGETEVNRTRYQLNTDCFKKDSCALCPCDVQVHGSAVDAEQQLDNPQVDV